MLKLSPQSILLASKEKIYLSFKTFSQCNFQSRHENSSNRYFCLLNKFSLEKFAKKTNYTEFFHRFQSIILQSATLISSDTIHIRSFEPKLLHLYYTTVTNHRQRAKVNEYPVYIRFLFVHRQLVFMRFRRYRKISRDEESRACRSLMCAI